jgi:predicted RNase H-like nuclease
VSAVLGIDAAWTDHHSSGVALVRLQSSRWECVALAPSYEAFVDPSASSHSDATSIKRIDPVTLLAVANQQLQSDRVQVVAIDMPLSIVSITCRRLADNLISEAFGRFGCGTHSPSVDRPGAISDRLRDGFLREGFLLHTASLCPRPPLSLIETFPHPALLTLCNCDYRLPYKVSRARRYWPTTSIAERRMNLKVQMRRILDALQKDIEKIPTDLLRAEDCSSSELKSIEDRIDALVCAWVGIKYLDGRANAYGDSSAAIWIPMNEGWRSGMVT